MIELLLRYRIAAVLWLLGVLDISLTVFAFSNTNKHRCSRSQPWQHCRLPPGYFARVSGSYNNNNNNSHDDDRSTNRQEVHLDDDQQQRQRDVHRRKSRVLRPKQQYQLLPPLPCVPTLDSTGLLPPGTYYGAQRSENGAVRLPSVVPKPTCRVQVAWDVSSPFTTTTKTTVPNNMVDITKEDVLGMVSVLQNAMDCGLTTLQMKCYPVEPQNTLQYDVYKLFLQDTPKSITEEQCQLVVPIQIQDVLTSLSSSSSSGGGGGPTISPLSVRTATTAMLDRLGTDCIDNLQIQFPKSSFQQSHRSTNPQQHFNLSKEQGTSMIDDRYYLDLLMELQDLQRDGYIRSISTKDMSMDMYVNHMQRVNLHPLITTTEMDTNLCRQNPFLLSLQQQRYPSNAMVPNDDGTIYLPHLVAANPLAGGWLTNRYIPHNNPYRSSRQFHDEEWFHNLSPKEKSNWEANIRREWWTTRPSGRDPSSSEPSNNNFRSIWDMYQTQLLMPLRDMAQKHSVSIASVVLRYMLQSKSNGEGEISTLPTISSTVVSCRLLPEHHYWDKDRPYTNGFERIQQLREVVRFQLDDDDMDCLWELSGMRQRPGTTLQYGDDDGNEEYQVEESSTGLFIPSRKSSR
jgi:aryl-alcohol dehydrogenase-like predicted oxidoreductase